jgi:NH3-dependent NAD+ synthetase
VRGVVCLLHGGTDSAPVADLVAVVLGARPVFLLNADTERRLCFVAFTM